MALPAIRTFSSHYRQKYGHAVGKIPLDLGYPCPNRAKGGCIYCMPLSFAPSYLLKRAPISEQITEGKKHLLKGRFKHYFGYFQQETCTALPVKKLIPVFSEVLADTECVGLILSTRPDYVESDSCHAW